MIKKGTARAVPFSLSKNPGVDKGPQPLMFNPALATQGELPRRGKRRPPGGCASERMKTQRFSYFAGFAARRPAAAGQFRPVSRGGTSCFLQGKTRKNSKKWRSATFSTVSRATLCCSKYMPAKKSNKRGKFSFPGLYSRLLTRFPRSCPLPRLSRP